MKITGILRKVHFNLSVLAVTLSVTLLLTTVLCTKFLNQSIGSLFNIVVLVIMGMMMVALLIGFVSFIHHKKVETIEKWTLSLLSFSIIVLAFLFVFEFFLKP